MPLRRHEARLHHPRCSTASPLTCCTCMLARVPVLSQPPRAATPTRNSCTARTALPGIILCDINRLLCRSRLTSLMRAAETLKILFIFYWSLSLSLSLSLSDVTYYAYVVFCIISLIISAKGSRWKNSRQKLPCFSYAL